MRPFLEEFGLVGSAGQAPITFPCSFDVSAFATESFLHAADDTGATSAPGMPDLLAASDSGASDSDNITNVTTPVFRVSLPPEALEGDTLRVYRAGSVEIGNNVLDGTDIGNGYTDVTASALSSGGHSITARVENNVGLSPAGAALAVTVDAVAPDAPGLALAAASDTGSSNSDGITADTTPTFVATLPGNAVAGDLLELRDGATVLDSKVLDAGDITAGTVDLTSSALAENSYTIDARLTDVAGNVGADSSGVSVTIDTTAPGAPTGIDVTPADQGSGPLQTDSTQPTFRIGLPGSAVAGDTVTLEIDTVGDAAEALSAGDITNGYVDIQSANVLADDTLYDISAFITDAAGNEGASNAAVEVEVGDASSVPIPAVMYDGVQGYLLHTGGPGGAADGADLTICIQCTFNSDGSAMALAFGDGTVPYLLVRNSDNTIDFIGGAAGAVFSVSTTAVAASLGLVTIIAGATGTDAGLTVTHAGGTIAGVNTAGAAGNLDLTSDLYFGSDDGVGDFLDADVHLIWLDATYLDAEDPDVIEQFVDTSMNTPRDPGADGSNPLDGDHAPLVCHKSVAASHTTNAGTGGDADTAGMFADGTSPGSYAGDFTPSTQATLTFVTTHGNSANQSGYTFTDADLGSAALGPKLVLICHFRQNLAGPGNITLSIDFGAGAISADQRFSFMASSGNNRGRVACFTIDAGMSETGTISINPGGQSLQMYTAVYRGDVDPTPIDALGTSTLTGAGVDTLELLHDVPSGSVTVIGTTLGAAQNFAATFTGITERYDADFEGRKAGAMDALTPGTDVPLSVQFSAATDFAIAGVVSFGPPS